MRLVILQEPTTIFTVLTVATAGLQLLEGISGGGLARSQADAEAEFLDAQAIQTQKQLDRDRFDLSREAGRRSARTRAVIAAQGGDTTSGTGLAILKTQAATAGRQRERLEDDAEVNIGSLQTRARETRRTGTIQQGQQIFGGVTRAVATSSTLFSPAPRLRSR